MDYYKEMAAVIFDKEVKDITIKERKLAKLLMLHFLHKGDCI